MENLIKQIIKYVFNKYEIEVIELDYPETIEIVNKKNKQRLEKEVGNKLRLGMQIRTPFVKLIKLRE